MNNHYGTNEISEAWDGLAKFLRSPKWWAKVIVTVGLLIVASAFAFQCRAQERATLVSSVKIPFSTYYKVTVSDSCNVYETKWNSHNWRGRNSVPPKTWDIIKTSKGKYFIKPVL